MRGAGLPHRGPDHGSAPEARDNRPCVRVRQIPVPSVTHPGHGSLPPPRRPEPRQDAPALPRGLRLPGLCRGRLSLRLRDLCSLRLAAQLVGLGAVGRTLDLIKRRLQHIHPVGQGVGPGPLPVPARLGVRVSNTMDVTFCVAAVEEALGQFGAPEIFNTDQGSQFTSPQFISVLTDAAVRISMDGRGRWMDNVFIERLWRSLKYECVYLHAFETGSELRIGLARWIGYYNDRRPHSSLKGRIPNEAYDAMAVDEQLRLAA